VRKVQRLLLALGLLAPLMLGPPPATAQTWPQRTVKFLLPLGPGSGVDIGARLLGDRLSMRWGQPVVVENRPGGDGIVAISAFVGAHDDHVLLASPTSSFTAHPYLHENLPYKPSDLLPERIAADVREVVAADPLIGERLAATGQLLNVGGPAEFAQATGEQREKIAAIAKELGIKPMQ